MNPKGVLRSIRTGQGSVSSERAKHFFGAVRATLKSGVDLSAYGAVRLKSSVARVSPKQLVSKILTEAEASSSQGSFEARKEALRTKMRIRRAVIQNVRGKAPLSQRLQTMQTIKKGEIVSEAQVARDRVRVMSNPSEAGPKESGASTRGFQEKSVEQASFGTPLNAPPPTESAAPSPAETPAPAEPVELEIG
jgi:hypothetical protein